MQDHSGVRSNPDLIHLHATIVHTPDQVTDVVTVVEKSEHPTAFMGLPEGREGQEPEGVAVHLQRMHTLINERLVGVRRQIEGHSTVNPMVGDPQHIVSSGGFVHKIQIVRA